MGEYRVETATSPRILATSDYVAKLREQCATLFLHRTCMLQVTTFIKILSIYVYTDLSVKH